MWWSGVPGSLRVRPEEFIRLKQTKIWSCEGKALLQLGIPGKNGPIREPHKSACPKFFQVLNLSRPGPPGVGKMGLVDHCENPCLLGLGEVGSVAPTSEPHNSVCPRSCPDLSRAETPGVERVGVLEVWREGLEYLL